MKFGGNWLWFLKNHDFIHVNSTVAGKYYKYKPDDGHLRFPIRTILTTVDLFFFLIWVLRPFQEYFTYIEPIVHRRWAKTGVPGEKPPDYKSL